ncbi:hypothetical protein ILUMI_08967 [Ignelater luminosus]|uniref:Retroviral polymerase SH3-like domain-containing protein n=1 Tax=Ignelater luminosus TaxID=2038154 RepID=A0A8K0GGI4_IGNLU|nr:hypothetical protein ILUMI_08967 [Ignelater luminosus]
MDKKAIKGYLIGYDDDERYKIWVKEENRVVFCKNVVFQKRSSNCDRVKLPLRDMIQNEGKLEEFKNEEFLSDSDLEEPDKGQDSPRNLRDSSALIKSVHLNNYVKFSEGIMTDKER